MNEFTTNPISSSALTLDARARSIRVSQVVLTVSGVVISLITILRGTG